MSSSFPTYTRSERVADAVVHALGVALALIASIILIVAALPQGDGQRLLGLGVYAAGLVGMLTCSALYNLTHPAARMKAVFQRLDHAAIFAMIAGSYTPLALVAIGGAWGTGLLAFVWTIAGAGMAVALLGLRRPGALLTSAYLLLGWTVLVAIRPLTAALSTSGLVLLVAGGLLYSIGTIFHHWRRLPFQNPIWHGFVVSAAACHYVAILREVAIS